MSESKDPLEAARSRTKTGKVSTEDLFGDFLGEVATAWDGQVSQQVDESDSEIEREATGQPTVTTEGDAADDKLAASTVNASDQAGEPIISRLEESDSRSDQDMAPEPSIAATPASAGDSSAAPEASVEPVDSQAEPEGSAPIGAAERSVESSPYAPWLTDADPVNWGRIATIAGVALVLATATWWWFVGRSGGSGPESGLTAPVAVELSEPIEEAGPQVGDLPNPDASVATAAAEDLQEAPQERQEPAAVASQNDLDTAAEERARIEALVAAEMAAREARIRAGFEEQKRELEEQLSRIQSDDPAERGAERPGSIDDSPGQGVQGQSLDDQPSQGAAPAGEGSQGNQEATDSGSSR